MATALLKVSRTYVLISTLAGALLGFGAPAGYILFSFVLLNPEHLNFISWCFFLLNHQLPLLIYLTVPTVLVFSLFGYYHGVKEARLAFNAHQMKHFLAIAAHDILSPLAVVKQATVLFETQSQQPLNKNLKYFTDMVNRQTQLMIDVVEELLNIYKMEAGKYQLQLGVVQIIPLLEKATGELAVLIQQKSGRVEIISDLPRGTALLLDSFKVRQVIRNLISNAVKYMPEAGTIQIRVLKKTQKNQNEFEIAICNEGECIPEQKLPFIFEKFVQEEDQNQKLGHGFGLSICKDIIELHRGKIWAENVKPHGVCFYICLPEGGIQ